MAIKVESMQVWVPAPHGWMALLDLPFSESMYHLDALMGIMPRVELNDF